MLFLLDVRYNVRRFRVLSSSDSYKLRGTALSQRYSGREGKHGQINASHAYRSLARFNLTLSIAQPMVKDPDCVVLCLTI